MYKSCNTLLILLSLLFCTQILAKDIYFEIHTNIFSRNENLKSELGNSYVFCKVYHLNGVSKIELSESVPRDKLKSIEVIKKICLDKVGMVFPVDLKTYLKDYHFSKNHFDYKVYLDKSGVSEINEIWVAKKKNVLQIVEKRSSGTTRIKYDFLKDSRWVKSAQMSIYEGGHSIKSTHTFYFNNEVPYPNKIISKYVQALTKYKFGKFRRTINEVFEFKNFKINQSVSLKYFAQKN